MITPPVAVNPSGGGGAAYTFTASFPVAENTSLKEAIGLFCERVPSYDFFFRYLT